MSKPKTLQKLRCYISKKILNTANVAAIVDSGARRTVCHYNVEQLFPVVCFYYCNLTKYFHSCK